MEPRGFRPERGGGLDGDDLPPPRREPRGIAPAAGADVEQQARRRGQERDRVAMDLVEAKGLVGFRELAEAAVVGADRVALRQAGSANCSDASRA